MMNLDSIENTVKDFLASLPQGVLLVAAAKTRSIDEVKAAVRAGITVLGYNYIQEAEQIYQDVGNTVHWHMIGNLQRNKVKKALPLFDMIETVDSVRLAEALDRQCALQGKRMPILIEINSGKELNKSGVFPDDVGEFIKKIHVFENIKIQGLMTMGPMFGNPEDARPYFKATKAAFDRITLEGFTNVEMRYLSMGMSNSYQIAIEEGANVVRIGTKLFGER